MKTFSASFLLPAILLASTVLSTHAQVINDDVTKFCDMCTYLPMCNVELWGQPPTLKELWYCMGGNSFNLPRVKTVAELKDSCCEEKCAARKNAPGFRLKFCEPTFEPTPGPITFREPTPGPIKSREPTPKPTTPREPTPKPTKPCTYCCDCVHTCSIYPDPHYRVWDNSFYDFQGGCDQHAIKNDIIEVQIATRPRINYSTITQVTVLMKQTQESFKISLNTAAVNTIVTGAVYSTAGNVHRIDFNNVPSFIKITKGSNGITLQVQGHGSIFSNSEGMCGSWNHGGVISSDGTIYSTAQSSFSLADSWKIPFTLNELVAPAVDGSNVPICDASKDCGPNEAFACNAVRKLQYGQDFEYCDKKCSDIKDAVFAEACEFDIKNTGDPSWACQPSYLEPVLKPASPCDFDRPDDNKYLDEKCKPTKLDREEGYVPNRLGGPP